MKKSVDINIILIATVGGVFVGFINGFFGGGGGMIVVPLLIFLLALLDKEAHATAIFVILPLSITSSVIYIINGNVDYLQLLWSSAGFIVGGVVGALLLKQIDNKIIRLIFSFVMIVAGVRMLF